MVAYALERIDQARVDVGLDRAEGPTEIVGGAEAQRRNATVAERYLTEAGRVGWARTVAPVEDVSIALVPERWTWWSPEAMFEVISDHGYTEEDAAGWFLPMDA